MNKKQKQQLELTQRFFNEFHAKAMSSRSDVSSKMTQIAPIPMFQFKCYDILEERRVEAYVGTANVLMVHLAKKEASACCLSDQREFVLANGNFDHVLNVCVEFFEKEMN